MDLVRYPDSRVEVLDERFAKYKLGTAAIEMLWTGGRWLEGPVWFGDGRYLLFSDIPNNRILKWEEETGDVSVFRKPSNNTNGNTRDREGRLLSCEHDARRVTRTEYDGSITVLMDSYEGKTAECAERRCGQIRRVDLVHGPRLRHPDELRRAPGRIRE